MDEKNIELLCESKNVNEITGILENFMKSVGI